MAAQRKHSFRPSLEVLEDRLAPAVSVTGGFKGMINLAATAIALK